MTSLVCTQEPGERIKRSFLTLTHCCQNKELLDAKETIVNGCIYTIQRIQVGDTQELMHIRDCSYNVLASMGSIKQNNRWIREFAFADKTLSDVAEIVEQVVEIILQMDLDTRCWISLDSYRFSCRTCVELQRLISPGRLNERIY